MREREKRKKKGREREAERERGKKSIIMYIIEILCRKSERENTIFFKQICIAAPLEIAVWPGLRQVGVIVA